MKLTFLEFLQVISGALYVFTSEDSVDLKELLSYIKEDALRLKRKRKDA